MKYEIAVEGIYIESSTFMPYILGKRNFYNYNMVMSYLLFILVFLVFPGFQGSVIGHKCFKVFEKYTKLNGAEYYELNSQKENSI